MLKTIIKKIILSAIIVLLVVAVALLVLFLIFTRSDQLKTQIVRQIDAQTGLPVQVHGPVNWVLVPQLGINLDGVELQQPLGLGKEAVAKSQRVEAVVAWRPLLSGQIKIQKLIFHQFSLTASPHFSQGSVNTQIAGEVQIDVPTQRLSMDHAVIEIGSIQAAGTLSGQKIFHNPEFAGQFKIAQLDLAQTLHDFSGETAITGNLSNIVVEGHASFEQGFSGQIYSERLMVNSVKISHFATKFTASPQRVQLTAMQGAVAGGTITGQVTMTDLATLPHYQIDGNLSHVELSQLCQSHILQGPADFTLHLTTLGGTWASLNGTVKLAVAQGILNHMDLLKQIRAVRQFLEANPLPGTHTTHFSQLTISGVITNGLFTSDDLILQSPELQASGAGQINLVDENLKYRLLVKAYGLSVPLKITGSLTKPKIKIDMNAMLQELN